MRIHVYVHIDELDFINQMLNGNTNDIENKISISSVPFKDSYLVDMTYDDFIRLKDNDTFRLLISI
jgi:hypothetical protein